MPKTGANRNLRTKFYERGNTACPICLQEFSREDLNNGIATIEHVPARTLAPKRSRRATKMCLTCATCNQGTSRVEDKLQNWLKHGHRDQMELEDGLVIPEVKWKRTPQGGADVRFNSKCLSAESIEGLRRRASSPDKKIGRAKIQPTGIPTDYEAMAAFLKAGYLAVFSLMGKAGYLYAASKAGTLVRRQILSPNEAIIRPRIGIADDEWLGSDSVAIKRNDATWVAIFDGLAIELPTDESIHLADPAREQAAEERKELFPDDPKWRVQEFSDEKTGWLMPARLQGGTSAVRAAVRGRLLGSRISVKDRRHEGRTLHFFAASGDADAERIPLILGKIEEA